MVLVIHKMTIPIFSVVIFLGLLISSSCDTIDRLDNLELKISQLDYFTRSKYLELKRKMNIGNGLGGNNGTPSVNTSVVEEKLKHFDESIDTFVDEQRERTRVISRSISEEKMIRREMMKIIKDLTDSNVVSVLEIEENVKIAENERAAFKLEWIAFQNEIRNDIKQLSAKIDNLQNTLANFDGNKIIQNGNLAKACEEGWTNINEACYLYKTDTMTWLVASFVCSELDGKLAEPDTEAKFQAILDVIKDGDQVWIGGTDVDHEGTWMWEYMQTPVTLNHWETRQPNNLGGGQNCLEIGLSGELNDESCNAKNKFVCEKSTN